MGIWRHEKRGTFYDAFAHAFVGDDCGVISEGTLLAFVPSGEPKKPGFVVPPVTARPGLFIVNLQSTCPVKPSELLVVYKSQDDQGWCRPAHEFLDGRFRFVANAWGEGLAPKK